MAVFKCKMCGGDLDITAGVSVAECEYCGSKQTVPTADNEKKITLFSRASRLLRDCEFDKAFGVFESIITDFPQEAEAYWGLLLCKYGIEYVDDPQSGKKIPTCHRSSFDSIMDDEDFELVLENADALARSVYRDEAKRIEALRKDIIEVSAKEEPYDIFICYKETAPNGDRTIDSVIAQDVYTALTERGYRVFFSRISLEDKLGVAYEPYIFAALNSAKIMLAFGTDYEYYNAVWVKNEWSRFLQLIAKGEKKTLIPCYKGLDAYDMPKEFAKLQAQDMGKVGAIQDLLRGIEKILPRAKETQQTVVVQQTSASVVEPLLKRVTIFLEDGKWAEADEYCEKVLDQDPENAQAYLGKLMAALHVKTKDQLGTQSMSLESQEFYRKVIRYADEALKTEVEGYQKQVANENQYQYAIIRFRSAYSESDFLDLSQKFKDLGEYKDCPKLVEECLTKAKIAAQEAREYEEFAAKRRAEAERKRLEEEKERQRIAAEEAEKAKQEQERLRARRKKRKILAITISFGVLVLALLSVFVIVPRVIVLCGDYVTYVRLYKLDEIEINDGTKTITDTTGIVLNSCSTVKQIKVPASVTSIDSRALYDCSNLRNITFAAGSQLTSIGSSAFSKCVSLTSIVLPEGLKTIGSSAFSDCTALTSITIPASVTTIDAHAFDGCSSLKTVIFANDSQLTTIGTAAFQDCDDLTLTTIPAGVTSIGGFAFSSCVSLTSVTFAEGSQLKSIEERTFQGCSFSSIVIPNSVTSIGVSAFYGCNSLTSVTVPNSVTSIGNAAFFGCSSLTSITIPDSVTSIGTSAFDGCSKLTSITIPDGVTSIGDWAFKGCSKLTSVTIPDSVTSIGEWAFYNCSSLTSITIPSSVISIGEYAFDGCSSLTSATFEQTSGWKYDSKTISASDLANTATAAKYLKATYRYGNWKRS